MSYTPTGWIDGDLITSQKLNKLEQGLADVSEGSQSKYDLVIRAVLSPHKNDSLFESIEVSEGDIEQCEATILSGGYVTGLLVAVSYDKGEVIGMQLLYFQAWDIPHRQIVFANNLENVTITYDEDYNIIDSEYDGDSPVVK